MILLKWYRRCENTMLAKEDVFKKSKLSKIVFMNSPVKLSTAVAIVEYIYEKDYKYKEVLIKEAIAAFRLGQGIEVAMEYIDLRAIELKEVV